jgi:hypothetical protein
MSRDPKGSDASGKRQMTETIQRVAGWVRIDRWGARPAAAGQRRGCALAGLRRPEKKGSEIDGFQKKRSERGRAEMP